MYRCAFCIKEFEGTPIKFRFAWQSPWRAEICKRSQTDYKVCPACSKRLGNGSKPITFDTNTISPAPVGDLIFFKITSKDAPRNEANQG
jgi:hypothetical protein